jgi:hypothetical protein
MPPGYSTHPNGCMPNATWSNLMVGFPLANWPSGSVPTLAVPMNLILSFPKRSREAGQGGSLGDGKILQKTANLGTIEAAKSACGETRCSNASVVLPPWKESHYD